LEPPTQPAIFAAQQKSLEIKIFQGFILFIDKNADTIQRYIESAKKYTQP
jgi:hypothetical protein